LFVAHSEKGVRSRFTPRVRAKVRGNVKCCATKLLLDWTTAVSTNGRLGYAREADHGLNKSRVH
jgi:hypothetical protein